MTDESYQLIVLRKGEQYVVQAPAFGMVRSGDDLSRVEQEIRAAMREALDGYKAAGVEPPATSTDADATGQDARSIRTFTIKTAIASTAVLLLLLGLGIGMKAAFNGVVRWAEAPLENYQDALEAETTTRLLAGAVAKVADTLDNITPERRVEVMENLHRISISLEPYMAQLRPLLGTSQRPSEDMPKPPAQP